MKKFSLIFFVFFLSFSAFSKECRAEEQNTAKGFSVNPFFQEINLEKDQAEKTFAVEITNNTENLAVLKLSVVDFGALDESGGVAFLGDSKNLTNKYSLASWISLENDGLVINSGEKQSVRVTIQNKESLAPGGHYAAILAKLDSSDNSLDHDASKVALDPSFSSLIFVRKIGGEIYGLSLKDQEISKGILGLPSNIRLRFQNTGNVHVTPHGLVRLSDPLGREVARGIINQESALILPETFRIFPTSLQKTALAFVPGYYKLAIDYRYDGKDSFTTEQHKIFVIPAIDILAGVIFMTVLYGGLRFRKRK